MIYPMTTVTQIALRWPLQGQSLKRQALLTTSSAYPLPSSFFLSLSPHGKDRKAQRFLPNLLFRGTNVTSITSGLRCVHIKNWLLRCALDTQEQLLCFSGLSLFPWCKEFLGINGGGGGLLSVYKPQDAVRQNRFLLLLFLLSSSSTSSSSSLPCLL